MEATSSPYVPERETASKNYPRTPPYTPNASRQRFQRADSPASVRSIHPLETISPTKPEEQSSQQEGVKVEELHEGDPGYNSNTELIYPEELEEPSSPAHSHTSFSSSSTSTTTNYSNPESEIAQHLSRLDCAGAGQETPLERRRRLRRKRKRTESRVFKRTHSQSLRGDAETSDVDGMPDQDRISSARRLRRRVQGPKGIHAVSEESQWTPPPSRGYDTAAGASELGSLHSHENGVRSPPDMIDDTMEVDGGSV